MQYSLCELPKDVLFNALILLPLPDLLNLCITSHKCNEICDSEKFWLRRTFADYPQIIRLKPDTITYKDWYSYHYNNMEYIKAVTPIIVKGKVWLGEIYIKLQSDIEIPIDIIIDALKNKYFIDDEDSIYDQDTSAIIYRTIDVPETLDLIILNNLDYYVTSTKTTPNISLDKYIFIEREYDEHYDEEIIKYHGFDTMRTVENYYDNLDRVEEYEGNKNVISDFIRFEYEGRILHYQYEHSVGPSYSDEESYSDE